MSIFTRNLFPLEDAPIASSDSLRASVHYERTRVDRLGGTFSVIVFDINGIGKKTLEWLADRILELKRTIDCVGWNAGGSMAVLLPDTNEGGAETFCRKIDSSNVSILKNLSYDIYTYPEHWLENSNEVEGLDCVPIDMLRNRRTVESLFVRKMPVWKRALDIIGSSVLLLLLSPLFLLLGLYIKVASPGPVFFHQTRIGYKGLPFTFWKFRTMKHNNNDSIHGKHLQSFIKDGDVPMKKLDKVDPRIIPGGRALRASCVDELPQLWNVLKGDMSLVGPRPCIPYEAQDYLRWHTHRFDTIPGLTGLWQVNGKEKLTFKEMIRLDIAYCNRLSPWMDLYILFKTPLVVLGIILNSVLDKKRTEAASVAPGTGRENESQGNQSFPKEL